MNRIITPDRIARWRRQCAALPKAEPQELGPLDVCNMFGITIQELIAAVLLGELSPPLGTNVEVQSMQPDETQLSPAGFKGGQGRTAADVEANAEGGLWIAGLCVIAVAVAAVVYAAAKLLGF